MWMFYILNFQFSISLVRHRQVTFGAGILEGLPADGPSSLTVLARLLILGIAVDVIVAVDRGAVKGPIGPAAISPQADLPGAPMSWCGWGNRTKGLHKCLRQQRSLVQ
jgi:hypothetical protein